jgi:hypothetical protein
MANLSFQSIIYITSRTKRRLGSRFSHRPIFGSVLISSKESHPSIPSKQASKRNSLRVLLLVHGIGGLLVLGDLSLTVGNLLPESRELLGLLLLDVETLLSGLLLVEGVAGSGTAGAGGAGVAGGHALGDGAEGADGCGSGGAGDGAGCDAERHDLLFGGLVVGVKLVDAVGCVSCVVGG